MPGRNFLYAKVEVSYGNRPPVEYIVLLDWLTIGPNKSKVVIRTNSNLGNMGY